MPDPISLTDDPTEAESSEAATSDADAIPGRGRLGTFRSLRYRDYRLLWISTLFASSGVWIEQITIGWVVHELTDSAFMLGAVNGVRSVPFLLLAPLGGVAADRVDPRRLMLAGQLVTLIAALTMATILITGHAQVWHLFVYTTVAGMAWSLNLPVRQSVVSRLVPRGDLMNAVALTAAGFNLTGIAGPSIAGFLLGALGPGENFYIQACMFATVALLVVQLRPLPPRTALNVSVRRNLSDGLSYVWNDRPLRIQLALALVAFVVIFPYIALLPIFADDIFGRGATGFGFMMTAVGFGSVIGTLVVASLSGIRRKGAFLVTIVGAAGCCLMLYALSPNYYLSLVMLAIIGALVMVFITTNNTLLQMAVPDELRGRVMGIYMLNQGLVPLGSLFAGALASVTSAQAAVFTLGAIATALAGLFALRAKSLRSL